MSESAIESAPTTPVYELGGIRWAAQSRLYELARVVNQLQRYAEGIEREGLEFDPSPAKLAREYAVGYTRRDGGDPERWGTQSLANASELVSEINDDRDNYSGRAEVVSRWHWTLPDGTTITTPWQAHDSNEEQQ